MMNDQERSSLSIILTALERQHTGLRFARSLFTHKENQRAAVNYLVVIDPLAVKPFSVQLCFFNINIFR